MRRQLGVRILREIGRRLTLWRARLWIVTHPREAARIRAERAWLFGASVGRAYSDNSAALHQYVRRRRLDIAAWWVIDRDSPDVGRARGHGPVLFRDTVECHVRALLAAVLVVSHGLHDVPGLMSNRCRAFRVRLGHGITATRARKPHAVAAVERANRQFDLVPVSSEFELQNKLSWGIPRARIAVTGVPRFDTLLARQREIATDPKRLLYMPTWRDGTVDSMAVFAGSDYARGLRALIEAPALREALERNDGYLHVAFHPIAKPFALQLFGELLAPRIVIEEAPDPQPVFARVGALVTDYSSVTWDFLYLDKPVFFYQFDRETLERERGSHIGEAGWPGPVARSAAELVPLIDDYLGGRWTGEQEAERVQHWKRQVFPYRDDRNCERVVAEIERRLAGAR